MASISGGQFHFSSGQDTPTGSSQGATAGHLSLTSIADYHSTVPGGETGGPTGFDSVNSPSSGGSGLAGQVHGASESTVVTQSQQGGNTVVHLPDGSSLTVVGVTHVDGSFFH